MPDTQENTYRLIADNGLLGGPNEKSLVENIEEAISKGYYVKVNVWKLPRVLCTGEFGPEFTFDVNSVPREMVLYDARNYEAYDFLVRQGFNVFHRESDPFAVSSWGWYLSFTPAVLAGSIAMDPEGCLFQDLIKCGGICSKYAQGYGK